MKTRRFKIFRRITAFVFILTTGLGLLFMGITYLAATHFQQAGTQMLNKDVAAHIAQFASPFDSSGINRQKADSVFYNAMVISPSVEVYFLDTAGRVIYFHAPDSAIRLWKVPLENIRRQIRAKGKAYLKAPDPKDPEHPKVFSSAEVVTGSKKLGYIYVILGSNEYRSINELLFSSHIGMLAVKAFTFIILISILLSLFYVRRMQKRFNHMIRVLQQFQQGDFEARFDVKDHDELAPVTESFNKMADLLVYNIHRLTQSENERKDFLASISHDLRTPLAVARGYTETLLIKSESQGISRREQEEHIKLVLHKIHQVENMVTQLFELSKMESVAFTPHKEPFVFSEVLQECLNATALTAAGKKIQLQCTGCETNLWIFGDVGMMERVVQNLLDNAVSYTPENGRIEILLEQQKDELVFEVINSGLPLPDELTEWINGEEVSPTPRNRPVKSAIGLAIVKKVLALHQYPFYVNVLQNKGNRFAIRMTIYRSSQ
jgi:signal transduction histidine kinase